MFLKITLKLIFGPSRRSWDKCLMFNTNPPIFAYLLYLVTLTKCEIDIFEMVFLSLIEFSFIVKIVLCDIRKRQYLNFWYAT